MKTIRLGENFLPVLATVTIGFLVSACGGSSPSGYSDSGYNRSSLSQQQYNRQLAGAAQDRNDSAQARSADVQQRQTQYQNDLYRYQNVQGTTSYNPSEPQSNSSDLTVLLMTLGMAVFMGMQSHTAAPAPEAPSVGPPDTQATSQPSAVAAADSVTIEATPSPQVQDSGISQGASENLAALNPDDLKSALDSALNSQNLAQLQGLALRVANDIKIAPAEKRSAEEASGVQLVARPSGIGSDPSCQENPFSDLNQILIRGSRASLGTEG